MTAKQLAVQDILISEVNVLPFEGVIIDCSEDSEDYDTEEENFIN